MLRNQELIEPRHLTHGTLSLGKCIVNIIKWYAVEILRLILMPLRAGNYYLMKAEALDELFKALDRKSFEQSR